MTHSRKSIIVCIALLTVLFAQATFADAKVMGDPEDPVRLASHKLWRGFINTVTGFCEILRQPIVCTMDDGIVGVPVGLVNGVFMSFIRTGAGIIEVITFPVPLTYEVGYDSIMNPDYVWQKAD